MTKWNKDNILKNLKEIISKICHFPYPREFKMMNKCDLVGAINRNGGSEKFRKLLKCNSFRNPNNYWTEETTLLKLKQIIIEIGHFPTQLELSKSKNNVLYGINKNGGIEKFRKLLDYEFLQNLDGYWTEERIQIELKSLISKLNHFPLYRELRIKGLAYAIDKFGGLNKFRKLLGYKLIRVPRNYWSVENTKIEIEDIIKKLIIFQQ